MGVSDTLPTARPGEVRTPDASYFNALQTEDRPARKPRKKKTDGDAA